MIRVEEVAEPMFWGEERVSNTSRCQCSCCTEMPTVSDSICCQEVGLDHVLHGHSCDHAIHGMFNVWTVVHTLNILCREVDVLEVVVLSLKDV